MKVIFAILMIASPLYGMGYYEIGVNGSFSKYQNSVTSYTKANVVGAALAYRFTGTSALQVEYSNTYQIQIAPYSTTRAIINVVSINLMIYVLGNQYKLQPYVKGGPGYMKRNYSYITESFPTIETKDESITAAFGGGIKYLFTDNFAIQGEANVYLTDFNGNAHYTHYTMTAGVNVMF
jgi:hypothetical protein